MKAVITLIITLFAMHVYAQEIAGRVRDQDKEPLINTTIQVLQDGIPRQSAITGNDGKYVARALRAGYYDVVATHEGYDTVIVRQVFVSEDYQATVNVAMKLSAKEQTNTETLNYRQPAAKSDERVRITRETEAFYGTPDLHAGRASYIRGPMHYYPSDVQHNKKDTGFSTTAIAPKATMPVNTDVTSYSNMRRFVNSGTNPLPGTVHIEEMINYFDYKYPQPPGDVPIAINTELTTCPWDKDHKLLRVGLQGRKTNAAMLPASNIVLLIDVSATMSDVNKLPLLVAGIKKLVSTLRAKDKIAIVTYGNIDGLLLPATSGLKKDVILDALDKLTTGGPTTGGKGIVLAYKVAQDNFIKDSNNRIVLATDGDFNLGTGSSGELEALIDQKQAAGIYLTCLGFGAGSYTDARIETLAAKGRGNYKYLDDTKEAQNALSAELYGTLLTVAKDVTAQIHFNPGRVAAYRMIGYENTPEDETKKDKNIPAVGTMHAGRTATILFEIIPASTEPGATAPLANKELAAIKCKYRRPNGDSTSEISHVIQDRTIQWGNASENTRFAAAVAIFGMLLSDSKHAYNTCFEDAMKFAKGAMDYDEDGYREEFVKLVRRAKNNDINANPLK